LRDVDPTVATFCLFGMILWTSRWYRKDGQIKHQDALRDFSEMALNAVLRSPAPHPMPAEAAALTQKAIRTQ
jgi:hypothetical protein